MDSSKIVKAVLSRYHYTHRRNRNKLPSGHIEFLYHKAGDEARNSRYGRYVWILEKDLPSIPKKLVEFTADYYDVSLSEARDLVDPDDILNSAGAWDDPAFVNEVWSVFRPAGYQTQNGAIVLNPNKVKLIGPLHEDEYYEMFE